jgi:hypothetical protein
MLSQPGQDHLAGVASSLEVTDNAPYMINPVLAPPHSAVPPHRFPIIKEPKRTANAFYGARRAFLATHERKAKLAIRLQEATWASKEKDMLWKYRQEIARLTENIKLRDDEYLRRQNKPHPKPSEYFPTPTTGMRQTTAIPRERQCSLYPRNRTCYFGE